MKKSPVYQLLSGETEEAARQKGFQQGFQEGLEIGIARRAREDALEALMDVLEARFQLRAPQALKAMFEAVADLQHLKRLRRTALHAPNLEAVIQTLGQNENETA